jgi:hypothetical protein
MNEFGKTKTFFFTFSDLRFRAPVRELQAQHQRQRLRRRKHCSGETIMG